MHAYSPLEAARGYAALGLWEQAIEQLRLYAEDSQSRATVPYLIGALAIWQAGLPRARQLLMSNERTLRRDPDFQYAAATLAAQDHDAAAAQQHLYDAVALDSSLIQIANEDDDLRRMLGRDPLSLVKTETSPSIQELLHQSSELVNAAAEIRSQTAQVGRDIRKVLRLTAEATERASEALLNLRLRSERSRKTAVGLRK